MAPPPKRKFIYVLIKHRGGGIQRHRVSVDSLKNREIISYTETRPGKYEPILSPVRPAGQPVRKGSDGAPRESAPGSPAPRRAVPTGVRAREVSRAEARNAVGRDFHSGSALGPPIMAMPSGGVTKLRAAKYDTWFKATGTMGGLKDLSDPYNRGLLDEDLEDFAAPAQFYSNQGTVLGRVKWTGIVPPEDLIAELNLKLQYEGEEIPGFDFRDVYSRWDYTYQIVESIGGVPTRIYRQRDYYPKRGRGKKGGKKRR
ncbi:MAG: hypothetical protein ACYC0F_18060 [Rhodanobacter sp.]